MSKEIEIRLDDLYASVSFGGGAKRGGSSGGSKVTRGASQIVKAQYNGQGVRRPGGSYQHKPLPHVQWAENVSRGITKDLTDPARGSIKGTLGGGGGGGGLSPEVPQFIVPLS